MKPLAIFRLESTPSFSFTVGEFVLGTVLERQENGMHLLQVHSHTLSAYYAGTLTGTHVFKVIDVNPCTLQVLSHHPKHNSQSSIHYIISELKGLQSFAKDPLMHTLIQAYLTSNTAFHEQDMRALHNFLKKNPEYIPLLTRFLSLKPKQPLRTLFELTEYQSTCQSLIHALQQNATLPRRLLRYCSVVLPNTHQHSILQHLRHFYKKRHTLQHHSNQCKPPIHSLSSNTLFQILQKHQRQNHLIRLMHTHSYTSIPFLHADITGILILRYQPQAPNTAIHFELHLAQLHTLQGHYDSQNSTHTTLTTTNPTIHSYLAKRLSSESAIQVRLQNKTTDLFLQGS